MSPKTLRKHFAGLRSPVPSGGTALDQEFKRLTQGAPPAVRTDAAQQLANKSKNRFQNILPFDQSRVKLTALPGIVGSDYINASYIDGFKQRHEFIATQGPLQDTIPDFWRMVWEQESSCIVMLTQLEEGGRVKSERYWPVAAEGPLDVGDLQVVPSGEEHLGYALERTFVLVNPVSDQSREVKHWQFVSWPSSGEMASGRDLLDLIQRVRAFSRSKVQAPEQESIYGNSSVIEEQAILKQLRPTVVHCSAGVGRTGAFCAAAICLQRMQDEGKIDLFQVVKHLRTQRPGMVQTAEQYAFVYRCVLDWLDMQAPAMAAAGVESVYGTPLSSSVPPPRPSVPSSSVAVAGVTPTESFVEVPVMGMTAMPGGGDAAAPPPLPSKGGNINLGDASGAETPSGFGFDGTA